MGMDSYIYRVRNKKQPEEPNFFNECINKHNYLDDDFTKPAEMWYARKFYDFHEYVTSCVLNDEYECGEYVEINKKMLEDMINYATHNKDFFDSFNTVPDLCQALAEYDEAHEQGWIYVYECDW